MTRTRTARATLLLRKVAKHEVLSTAKYLLEDVPMATQQLRLEIAVAPRVPMAQKVTREEYRLGALQAS